MESGSLDTTGQLAYIAAPASPEQFLQLALGLAPRRITRFRKSIARSPSSFRCAKRRDAATAINGSHDAVRFFAAPARSNQIHRLFAWYAKCDQRINRRITLDAEDGREVAAGKEFIT